MQVPAVCIKTVAPLVPPVVQTVGVVLAKVMGLPDCPPVPASVKVPPLAYVTVDVGAGGGRNGGVAAMLVIA